MGALKQNMLGAIKRVAAAADQVRAPRPGIVILLYHRVGGGSGLQVDLAPSLFEEQMACVAQTCHAVGLDEAVDCLRSPTPPALSPPPVAVTFDDGAADVLEHALPILVQHRVPALIYVATHFVETGDSFPHAGKPASWAALRDAMGTGFVAVGTHTHTHALLDRLSPAEAEEELRRSQGLIQDRLGVHAGHFAYPKARPAQPAVQAVVRARCRSAALGGNRANQFGRTDVFALARSPIQAADGMRWFERKLRGGMALEETLRKRLDNRRYANLVH